MRFQSALSAGLARARQGEAVVTMDADLQDPPEVIPELVAAWQRGAEVVRAVRRTREETGLRRVDGHALPDEGEASLFFPAGADGPVFLVTANFTVIKRYNASDAYALGVASLGDRLFGGAPIQASWPVEDPLLGLAQRVELQRSLTRLGYDVGEPNGQIGSRTRAAIRDFQERAGLRPDGYPNRRVLEALKLN